MIATPKVASLHFSSIWRSQDVQPSGHLQCFCKNNGTLHFTPPEFIGRLVRALLDDRYSYLERRGVPRHRSSHVGPCRRHRDHQHFYERCSGYLFLGATARSSRHFRHCDNMLRNPGIMHVEDCSFELTWCMSGCEFTVDCVVEKRNHSQSQTSSCAYIWRTSNYTSDRLVTNRTICTRAGASSGFDQALESANRQTDCLRSIRAVLGREIPANLYGGDVLAKGSEPKLVASHVDPESGAYTPRPS